MKEHQKLCKNDIKTMGHKSTRVELLELERGKNDVITKKMKIKNRFKKN